MMVKWNLTESEYQNTGNKSVKFRSQTWNSEEHKLENA